MDYLIRTDASNTIGTGHVMRCLTLANAIVANAIELNEKAHVTFVCASHSGHLQVMLREHGHTVISIKPCDTQSNDAAACLSQINQEFDLLIVDHYKLGSEFEVSMRQCCHHVMVIDDLANRVHRCDVLLDQNFLPNLNIRYQSLINSDCTPLLGPRYSLLRPEFYNIKRNKVTASQRLLIFLGGSDPANFNVMVLESIAMMTEPMEVDLVLGENNPWNDEIIELYKEKGWLTVHIQCNYMGKLMSESRMSIGAGGSSHWERCACSLPALVMTVADNQLATTAYLARLGACVNLGKAEDVSATDLSRKIVELWQDEKKLLSLSDMAQQQVPTDGTQRVIEQLNRFKPSMVHHEFIGECNE